MAQTRLKWSIPGTRLFTPPLAPRVNGKREPCPVIIPEGKCVYWWVGCDEPRYLLSETMCRTHYYELNGWTPGAGKQCPTKECDALANRSGGPCRKCYKKRQRAVTFEYRQEYKKRYRARKKAERRARDEG